MEEGKREKPESVKMIESLVKAVEEKTGEKIIGIHVHFGNDRQFDLKEIDFTDDYEGDFDEPEPCPTCGDIEGMVNPCCANYDPLNYKNCGYG